MKQAEIYRLRCELGIQWREYANRQKMTVRPMGMAISIPAMACGWTAPLE